MNFSDMLDIKILPSEITSSLYNLDSSLFHLSYKDELRIFNCVKQGDLNKLFNEMKCFESINVGKMSNDDIRQYRYMAVSSITLATRYAIEGGLNDKDAYTYSDLFINKIDECSSITQIVECIAKGVITLTNSVANEKKKLKYSPHIRKCITFINNNLNKKIAISDLAEECGLSADYLSHIFKKEMNIRLSSYILKAKLEAAKQLLIEGIDTASICYALSFSSQSHFISVFKKEYSLTPKEYIERFR